jgi:ATP-binding cassette, subfamily B, bacterial
MAGSLTVISGIVVVAIFRIAAAGKPLHHDFDDKAAAVDGKMVDVIGNIALVQAFGGLLLEHCRSNATVSRELTARSRSLRHLEKLHALVTATLMLGLLAWAIRLWQQQSTTAGDVILVCTLGLSVLSATRDLSVALRGGSPSVDAAEF